MTAVVAENAPDLTSPRLVPRVRIKPDRLLPIIVAFSLLVHALVLLPLLLRDDPVSKPQEQEIPVELVQEPPKQPEKKAETPASQSAAKPETKPEAKPEAKPETKPETKPPEQKKSREKPPEEKHPEQKAPEQKPPQEKQQEKQQDQKRPEQKQPERKQPDQKAQEQKPSEPERKAERQQQQPAESQAERMHDLLGEPPPGMGAIALPGTAADGTVEVSYGQLVMSNVAKAKRQGRYQGRPGHTLVSFSLGDAGEVTRVAVREPSGSPDLDEEAVAMIKRGAPYPPPPPGAPRSFTVGLAFRAE